MTVEVALPLITTWPSAWAAATAVGLLTLCYQLGGAFGPALATLLIT